MNALEHRLPPRFGALAAARCANGGIFRLEARFTRVR